MRALCGAEVYAPALTASAHMLGSPVVKALLHGGNLKNCLRSCLQVSTNVYTPRELVSESSRMLRLPVSYSLCESPGMLILKRAGL